MAETRRAPRHSRAVPDAVASGAAAGPAARFLLCPPEHFDTHFLYGYWTAYRPPVDKDRAWAQWRSLVRVMEEAGARLDYLEPSPDSGAHVFTADIGLVYAPGTALVLRNDGPRGALEPPHFGAWCARNGFLTARLPPAHRLDGGNILRLHDGTYALGCKPGTDERTGRELAAYLRRTYGLSVAPVRLTDPAFLHLDLVLGRLGGRGYLVFPGGLDLDGAGAAGRRLYEREVITVDRDDAEHFACNMITLGDLVITGPISSRLKRRIARLGFWVERLPLTEFFRLGGGAKCLTMPLQPL